jgi:hypothetical protein
MKILAFDLSSHTGWAVIDGSELLGSGHFDVTISDWKNDISKTEQFPPQFPKNFAVAVRDIVNECEEILNVWKPDLVVTEFIEGSSRRFSQMFLDWLHFEFYSKMTELNQPYKYILNSDWRNHCGCWISQHPDLKKYNAKVGRAKRAAKPTKSGAKVAKIDGKVVSRVNGKKLSIMLASKHFNLDIKSDDEADAINQCRAAQAIWGKNATPAT